MKQKQLLKPLFLLCALLVGGLNSLWAADETITFSEQGYSNQQEITTVSGTNFTITFNKGTNSNAPKYYTSGTAIRAYGGNFFTVSSTTKTIEKIEITFGSSDGSNAITTDVDTYKNGTWTGSASSVTFTIGGTTGNRRLASIAVTYASSSTTNACATPTFNPKAGVYTTTQNVTISTTTDGATIYYTTDGTDPTTNSNAYTAAIPVSTTTTIKAIAVKNGMDNSAVATATYTIVSIEHAGTEADPYTVADARAAIDANEGITDVYVTGIVSEIVTAYDSRYGNISYNISADGSTTGAQLEAFRGKSYNGENFTSEDDIQVGDEVVIYGNLVKYNSTYELAQDNQLVSLNRPGAKELSSITLSGTYTTTFVEGSEFNHDGVVVTATYSDNSTADVTDNATFSAPDMNQIGTQTITVTYQEKTATYDINITAAPSHTVTFSINGEESTNDFKENANITFPADPEAISGMQFIGWTDAEISGTTNTAPTLISTATMGTTDVTYYAVFAAVTPGDSETVTDELTNATTGVEGSTYTEWTATETTSGAAYAGQSAGGNSSIQLRSKNSNSGIISTTSAGRVKKVVVEWNTNTTAGQTLDIYGNNTAYTAVTELYATGDKSNQGEKLGSIVNGTSTELTIDGNYAYIGLRSYNGAMYLDKISITWESGTPDIYSNYCTTIPTSIDITVSAAGYKAYNTVMATDFTKTEGLKAFAVTAYSDASVTLNEVEAAPAGTPLVLKANGGDYTLYAAEETPAAPANLLKVSNGTVKGNGSTIYALANVNGPGFYVVQEGLTIPTNYIEIPTGSNAPALSFDFGEGTTGIRSIENGQLTIDNVYYDLSGRKLNAMPTQKGVYIVNGKKVVIK